MAMKINLERNLRPLALNRCCSCGYEWQDQPFGLAKYHACPKCDSAYWEWTNFDDNE